ncbi:MAG: ABC transporter ATP-binding protein [Candidatus Omnitrophica bacterium]|nr:ABC transporter ATP-binding protein [Candidatus Omnitrophota bacterium]
MPELRLENVGKSFGRTPALQNINLSVEEGTFCVVLGPSGCGKSTLLNVVAGLEVADEGRIYLGVEDITDKAPHKRNIAMVFQSYALYPHLSVFENIAFGLRIKGEKEEQIKEKVTQVARSLNIRDKLKRFPRELSGGERQRVATGRAIVREPELFLFDEPLSNLDARLRIELRAELIKLHRRLKKTVLYVTHDQTEALSLGEKIVVMRHGVIQQVSSPCELYDDPANLFVAGFIGSPPMNIMRLFVVKKNGVITLKHEGCVITLPQQLQNKIECYIGKELYVGVRASAVRFVERDGMVEAEVVFTETLGDDSFVRVRLDPHIEITVRTNALPLLSPQAKVQLAFDPSKIYFFDTQEQRLYV